MTADASSWDLVADVARSHPPGEGPGRGLEPARAIVGMAAGSTFCDPEAGHLLGDLQFDVRDKIFERVLRMSGGRSQALGSDVLVHHASSFRVTIDGEHFVGRLVGIPILYIEGAVDDRVLASDGDAPTSAPVAVDAFEAMARRAPHPGFGEAHVLPILPSDDFTDPGVAAELLVAARKWIEAAIVGSGNWKSKPRLKLAPNVKPGRSFRRLGSSRPERLCWHGDYDAPEDLVVGALALGVVLAKGPMDVGRQCGGVLTPSARHPGVWYGTAQPFVHAASDLTALGLLAKLRRRCGVDPFAPPEGETLHVCEREGELYLSRDAHYALELGDGAVAATPEIGHDLAWYGQSFSEALGRAVSERVDHSDASTMPARRSAGAPDPRATTEDNLALDAVGRQLGFDRLAEAFDRSFRSDGNGSSIQIEGRTVGNYLGASVWWSESSIEAPRHVTIGSVVQTISKGVAREMLGIVGDRHADDAKKGRVAEAWARRIGDVPLMMVLIDDKFDGELLKSVETDPDPDDEQEAKTVQLDAGDGYRVSLNFGRAQSGSEELAFKSYFADLLSAEGELVSALTITVARKRRKTDHLHPKDFLYDMDSQSDELMSLGVRLLEVAGDADDLFADGAIVLLRWFATRDDMRRQGHATRLLDVVLGQIKRDRLGIGKLIVPLHAPNMRVTPRLDAPADLLGIYKALTLPARTMFSRPDRFAAHFGGSAPILCFDNGLSLTQVEFAVMAGRTG